MNIIKVLKTGLFIILVIAFFLPSLGVSATVAEKNRIPLLAGGPHNGNWQTNDLNLTYTYTNTNGKMSFSGNLTFADRLTSSYAGLSEFNMEIVFIDATGKEVERKGLPVEGVLDNWGDGANFSLNCSIPSQTTGMAFSYQGMTVTSGNNGSEGISIFHDPYKGW